MPRLDAARRPLPSRAGVGIGAGIIFFGMATGALFAVAYTVCLGRTGRLQPRNLALLVAGGGFLGMCLVPFLKYPANLPPSATKRPSSSAAPCTY